MNVAGELQKVSLLLHHDRLVPILEEVTFPPVPAVECPGVASEERPHHAGERDPASPEQQMRMVG
jgi:hypothetical protein